MHTEQSQLMWWLHRHPEGLESDLRANIGQNGISSGVGRQDLKFLVCYLSEGRNLLLNTRNNSGDSPSLGTSSPTVWNGSKRSGNFSRVANSGLARMSVASSSQIGRMSLGDSYVTRHGRKSVVSHHKSVGGRSQVYHDGRALVGGAAAQVSCR